MKRITKAVSLLMTLVLVVMVFSPVDEVRANSKKEKFKDHTYQIIERGVTYEEAESSCVRSGGHLVTITSEEELKFVKKLMKSAERELYWIGMKREKITTDFYWVTGEDVSFTNWNKEEPNNHGGNEFYVMMRKSTGEWIDNRNNSSKEGQYAYINSGYICEWDKTEPTIQEDLTYPGEVKIKDVKESSLGSATITWDKASAAKGYTVYMKEGENSKYKKITSINNVNTVTYKKVGLKKGGTYYFIIRAYNKVLNEVTYGPLSNEIQLTLK